MPCCQTAPATGPATRYRQNRNWVGKMVRAFLFLLAGSLIPTAPASAATSACEELGHGTRIGNSVIVLAQTFSGGDYREANGSELKDLPPFCRIFAVASPHPSSRILIEIWMPEEGRWNGKLLGIGSGGAAGQIGSGGLAGGLRRGFAVVTTDMGSYPAGQPGIGFNFGDGRPEAIRDWAYRATHEMTVLAKDVVSRYYGRAANRAYFVGCSTGGHQALTEAQRYPEDYDGIIAGAPAHNRTHLHIRFAALRQLGMRPGAAIPQALWRAWSDAVLMACAGRDGGAPTDRFLTDPLQCTVSPRQLACSNGGDEGKCLTDAQVRAIEAIYDGTRNPRTGELIYFGDVRGIEQTASILYGDTLVARNFDLNHWSLSPKRSTFSFDFDHDMAAMDDKLAAEVNAMDPDLSRFAARGGKLIIHHGWTDWAISPLDSLDYYQRITADDRSRADFARLFLVPGMSHCAGGPGASGFGQSPELPAGSGPEDDLLLALDRWVEGGSAPDRLLARKMGSPVGPDVPGSRPICAFPKVPRYDGSGDPQLASSFTCTEMPIPEYERPARQYLR